MSRRDAPTPRWRSRWTSAISPPVPFTRSSLTAGPTSSRSTLRGRRKLERYLGPDETAWDERFRRYLHDDPRSRGTAWLRIRPDSMTAKDLSNAV
nr:hypothetical protein [Haloactinopolyspora sp.]